MVSWRWLERSVMLAVLTHSFAVQGFIVRPAPFQAKKAAPTRVNMISERTSELAGGGSSRAAFLRATLGSAAALAAVVAKSKEASAFDLPIPTPFGPKGPPELEVVVKVAGYSQYVNKLEQDLKAGALKGGDEDSVVVSRVLEIYLKPMQQAMLKVAPLMQIAGLEARERAKLLPSIMQGHLLELEMACGTKDAKEQLQEVEEVRETLDEFIALAKTRYEIPTPEVPSAPEGDTLGIFGCSFYGMKRTDGSNLCQPDP
eukprot:g13320.t1